MTRERKIYVAVLAAGMAALTVDRLTAGPSAAGVHDPSEYALTRTDAPAPPTPTPAPQTTTPTTSITPGGGLATRLRELTTTQPASRDLFRAPSSWAAPTSRPVIKEANGPEDFEKSHRLTAVLLKGKEKHAVVDGRMVAPGQAIDGYTLISVMPDMAIFRSRLGTAVLKTEIKAP
jgi:hypothetical protein